MAERRRLKEASARAFRAALAGGLVLVLAGGLLIVGSLAHFGKGNVLAGIVIVGLAGMWMIAGGSALVWRSRRLRSPRRSDWEEERRRDTAIH